MKTKRNEEMRGITTGTITAIIETILRIADGVIATNLKISWVRVVWLGIWLSALSLHAQCPAENKAFRSGEKVTYDLYFNWKFIWKRVGTATLNTDSCMYHQQPAYRFSLLSTGSKRTDFFFKMRDTLTCYVSPRLEPLYFRKAAEEGDRYTVDEAWFSYRDGFSQVKQKRTYRDGGIREMEYKDTRCIFDMLSILGQARSYNAESFRVGDKIHFPMATGKRVDEQTLIYRGKENVKANDNKVYRCLVFSFVEYEDGEEKEVITFFVSDDENHLPIRLDMYLRFGSAKAFFKKVQGNRYPLTCVVKDK